MLLISLVIRLSNVLKVKTLERLSVTNQKCMPPIHKIKYLT